MTVKPIYTARNSRIALIFAGWGMDERPFEGLRRGGYDLAVVYDYVSQGEMPQWVGEYHEVCVIAWSYGVCMAQKALAAHPEWPVTLRVAVNGTPMAVDDRMGIPCAIYEGTLQGLSERSVYKFYRRMFSDAERFAAWKEKMPQRSIDSLRDELWLFGELSSQLMEWETVYIAEDDAIIPAANQHFAWSYVTDVRTLKGGHFPDFQQILNEVLIDKAEVEQKFASHTATYDLNATVQRKMCERVSKMLSQTAPKEPERMVEIGAGTGMLTRQYVADIRPKRLELWDLSHIDAELPGTHCKCDAETHIASVSDIDIIASSATIQWMNSPKQFVVQCGKALAHGGVAVISTFGPSTFEEIRHLLPSPLRYPSAEEWLGVKVPGCRVNVEEQKETLTFISPRELLRHISLTGVNGCGVDTAAAQRACRAILNSNINKLTYHCIYICLSKTT